MFSTPLKKRLVSYFACRYKIEITEVQAEEFLASFADLYEAMARMCEGKGEAVAGASAPRLPAPDLITPHYSPLRKTHYDL